MFDSSPPLRTAGMSPVCAGHQVWSFKKSFLKALRRILIIMTSQPVTVTVVFFILKWKIGTNPLISRTCLNAHWMKLHENVTNLLSVRINNQVSVTLYIVLAGGFLPVVSDLFSLRQVKLRTCLDSDFK